MHGVFALIGLTGNLAMALRKIENKFSGNLKI